MQGFCSVPFNKLIPLNFLSEDVAESPPTTTGQDNVMPSSVKKIGRTPPRYPPKPTFLEVSKDRTFSLKLRTPSQGVSILRFLFTKFYARGEVLTDTEVILLELLKIYFEELRNAPFGKQVLRDRKSVV